MCVGKIERSKSEIFFSTGAIIKIASIYLFYNLCKGFNRACQKNSQVCAFMSLGEPNPEAEGEKLERTDAMLKSERVETLIDG